HSNDGSLDYLRELLDQDQGRSQLYVQETNGGAAAARMRAAQKTSAQLIAFLDQDDVWHPQKLQLQVEYMLENPDCGAVHSDVAFIEENDQVITGAGVDENARRALINWSGTREEVSRILFE
ncbi:MAG TPA: glycosyltransferase, partial [Planctomycetes bacterium]|nr:glycosyltransferase [Planctomycetota bacterium]